MRCHKVTSSRYLKHGFPLGRKIDSVGQGEVGRQLNVRWNAQDVGETKQLEAIVNLINLILYKR